MPAAFDLVAPTLQDPDPLSATLVVGLAAPVVTVSFPVDAPTAVGEKVTPIVQVPEAGIVFPLQVSLEIA